MAFLWIIAVLVLRCNAQGTWYQRDSTHHHYYVSTGLRYYVYAIGECASKGGYLVTINDTSELNYIRDNTYSGIGDYHWIGLYSICEDRCTDWKWVEDDSDADIPGEWWDVNYPQHYTNTDSYVLFYSIANGLRNIPGVNAISRRYICEVPDACYNGNPCENGTPCTTIERTNYECDCTNTGYTGPTCAQDRNECSDRTHDCQNGATCRNTPGSYTCQCADGITGDRCQTDVDECANNDDECVDGNGICENTLGSYRCNCNVGYAGNRCQINIDECVSQECVPGTCIDGINGFTCDCSGTGYSGSSCGVDIDECDSNSHQCDLSHSACTNTPGSYVCQCFDGYTGSYCTTDIDECSRNHGCMNGVCLNNPGSYSCRCNDGFTDQRCQININECASNPCVNGYCVDEVDRYDCTCRTGYTGPECTIDVDECEIDNYCNYGTCNNTEGGYHCACPGGYTGYNCESDVDECYQNDTCSFHGNCTNTIGHFNCTCDDGYLGDNCANRHESNKQKQHNTSEKASVGVGIGIAMAVIVLICAASVIIAVFVYRKRKLQKMKRDQYTTPPKQTQREQSSAYDELTMQRAQSSAYDDLTMQRAQSSAYDDLTMQRAQSSAYDDLTTPNKVLSENAAAEVHDNLYEITEVNTLQVSSKTIPDNFSIGNLVGKYTLWKGQYAFTYKGTYMNETCAVKTRRDDNGNTMDLKWLSSQIKALLIANNHPNIVRLVAFSESIRNLAVVTHYAEMGDLKTLLSTDADINTTDGETVALRHFNYAIQIADGMIYLRNISKMDILHFELSARHILVGKDNVCKITNFASAEDVRNRQRNSMIKNELSMMPWLAPECILSAHEHDTTSDVWSFGVLLYEITTNGSDPYPNMEPPDIALFVLDGNIMKAPPSSDHLYGIMGECWRFEPKHRPVWNTLKTNLSVLCQKHMESTSEYEIVTR